MERNPHAKSAILALIGAVITVLMLYPLIAAARYEDEPQLFINYEQFHKKPESVSAENKSNAQAPKSKRRIAKKDIPQAQGAYAGRHYSKEEVQQLIIQYSEHFRISSETPLCIAKLESGYNQFSKNKSSTASGVFQYLASTWKATDQGKIGLSVFDADANVKAAVSYMAIHKSTRPWIVAPKCPKLTFLQ